MISKVLQKLEEVGEVWGFVDQCEATTYKVSPEEHDRWYGTWQCTPAVQFLHDFGDDEDDFWRRFDYFEAQDRESLPVSFAS